MTHGRQEGGFDGPAVYRIVVQGHLQDDSALGDMRIVSTSAEGGAPITTLEGRLQDQAELSGVLNTLYDCHLSIVTVGRQGDGSDTSSEDQLRPANPKGEKE